MYESEGSVMRRFLSFLIVAALLTGPAATAGDYHHDYKYDKHEQDSEISINSFSSWEIDEAEFQIDDDRLVITPRYATGDEIVMTKDRRLIVNGRDVSLDSREQALVGEFYDLTYQIRNEAKAVAFEGVKLGLKGARLGVKAVGGVLKLLFTGYDEDEFEYDMELAAEKLEREGESLEKRAETVEDLVEHWEEVGEELIESVPELERMDWLR